MYVCACVDEPRLFLHRRRLVVLSPICALSFHVQIGEADDGAGGKILINKYESKICRFEQECVYATDMRTPKIPVVINENQKNVFGSARGYKVQLNRPLLNLEPEGYDRSKALGEL